MNLEILAMTLEAAGTVMIAFTALMVHHRVRKEHSIDERVSRMMKREQFLGWTGVSLIIIGYFITLAIRL
ncbi:MAG: hypothetical protein ABIJ81_00945 [Patescibacteria group bacterium]